MRKFDIGDRVRLNENRPQYLVNAGLRTGRVGHVVDLEYHPGHQHVIYDVEIPETSSNKRCIVSLRGTVLEPA